MLKGRAVTVLGAGIAGLAVARALALRGAEVTVLEQAEAIREAGAGLQISPNGARVLRALGLGEALDAAGLATQVVELWNGETGTRVAAMPMGQGFRLMHRADLIAILAEGARAAGVQIRLLQHIDTVRLGDHAPQLITAQGAEIEVPLLIGADGLHSRVRAALNGGAAPFFTHQVAWRAVIPCEPGADPIARVYMGAGRHLVSYPLRGGRERNIVAVEERRRWVEESWSLEDDPLTLRAAFAGFCPEVQGWLAQVQAPGLWGLFRHPVAPRWHGQGAAILGDAVHPTLPFLAQGAVMALEDAWVLAAMLDRFDTPEVAFAAYQTAREARVRRIVDAASANARNYHLSGLPRVVAHLGLRGISALAPGALLKRFDWIYDADVTQG